MNDLLEDVAGTALKTAARPYLPWVILAAVLLLGSLLGWSFYEGWSMRGDREAANQLEAVRAWQAKLDAERVRGDKLAGELELEKRNIKTRIVEVVKEIPKVTTVYVEKPGEAPKTIPPAVYTTGYVRLWNNALTGLPVATSEPVGSTGGSDLARSNIDSPDLLTNHAINASKYAECRAELNKLIDWHQGKQESRP